jgi:hypothetical protein
VTEISNDLFQRIIEICKKEKNHKMTFLRFIERARRDRQREKETEKKIDRERDREKDILRFRGKER